MGCWLVTDMEMILAVVTLTRAKTVKKMAAKA
jgi:hypothetical protein